MPVLVSSVSKTMAMLSAIHSHSVVEIFKAKPKAMAITDANKCILKLSWLLVA